MVSTGVQLAWLLILSIPVACVSWTVTHEEVFREPRDYCQAQSKHSRSLPRRKFFYLFTCEYCFSHYVAALFLIVTRYKLLYLDWRGYVIALFSSGLGGKSVHEHLQPPPARHQARAGQDSRGAREKNSDSRSEGSVKSHVLKMPRALPRFFHSPIGQNCGSLRRLAGRWRSPHGRSRCGR